MYLIPKLAEMTHIYILILKKVYKIVGESRGLGERLV